MKLSILDLSIVPPSGNRHEALKNTLELAQQADRMGILDFGLQNIMLQVQGLDVPLR